MKPFRILALLCFVAASAPAESPRGYYRFPSLRGETVVFTAEGDLWRVALSGGVAQRLTTHPGSETHAAVSPDGLTVAFTAEYEGTADVYTMPLAGGLPRRLTFGEAGARVEGWAPTGEILYSTMAFSTLPNRQLALIAPGSGAVRVLPLAQASQGVFDPESNRLFFTRLAEQGSSTKRYQGGTAENLWSFREGEGEAVALTSDFRGTSRNPMWWNGRVYFASDRDGIMNLWSMNPDGADLRQHTRHTDYDVRRPALDSGRIVYQHGADLRLLDLAAERDEVLHIRLASDFDQQRERWVKKPMDFLTAAHLSPNGDRLALTARGQVFVAPLEQGRLVEVPRRTEVRYRNARFMPDGKTILAQTDETGEIEFCLLPANGVGQPTLLTTNGSVFRFEPVPSPNGKRLAWADKDLKLWIHDVEAGESTLVLQTPRGEAEHLAWSPDSQWLAFTWAASNFVQQVLLYNVTNRSLTPLTSDRVESFSPAWSTDGQWLYFLSDRQLRSLVPSPWGPRQPDPFFTDTTQIFAFALQKDARWPFRAKDELASDPAEGEKKQPEEKPAEGAKTEAAEAKPAAAKGADAVKPVVIDLEGLSSRLYQVPVPAGNYSALEIGPKHLLWLAREVGFDAKTHLRQLEITRKDPKPKTLVEDVSSYEMSADRKKLLVRKQNAFHVIATDAAAPAKLEDKFNLEGWTFSLLPAEEWRQVYTESWRMMRDYFYDRNMHGVDWRAMHAKYRPLVDRVSDRAELNDVIAAMVGELSALHIFVRGGDQRESPDQIQTASLGVTWFRDEPAGGWRIRHLYRADPDYPGELGPLARPEIGAQPGDVITRINGRSTLSVASPELLLRNQAGRQVLLEIQPFNGGSNRVVIVQPLSPAQDADLRYNEWELTRRELVEQLGDRQIGYVHLRAMGAADIARWARDFFPAFNRQGLIIDVRHNRGGNIDSWILGKLLRKAWFYWQPPVGEPYWNMQYAFRGHMVVLCNEQTASDGEAFSEGFRRLGLGKVIGTRTWGGEIWLSAQRWLVDSGMATAAEIGVYGPEGEWLIEGHGVDPDLVVDNLPHETYQGRDAQLEAAVKHLKQRITEDPRPVPPAPKYPDKSFRR